MWNLKSLQCCRMPSFLAIADFLRPQSLELGSTFIYGVRISFESFSGVYMRSLAEAWPDPEIVPQLVALLPWGHLRVLLDQLKNREEREWYLRAAVEYGWSRNV